jgi:hypothetical protein
VNRHGRAPLGGVAVWSSREEIGLSGVVRGGRVRGTAGDPADRLRHEAGDDDQRRCAPRPAPASANGVIMRDGEELIATRGEGELRRLGRTPIMPESRRR